MSEYFKGLSKINALSIASKLTELGGSADVRKAYNKNFY